MKRTVLFAVLGISVLALASRASAQLTAATDGPTVPDLRRAVDRIKASGHRMVTRAEVPPAREVKDDIAPSTGAGSISIAYAMGPDDGKVELLEDARRTLA